MAVELSLIRPARTDIATPQEVTERVNLAALFKEDPVSSPFTKAEKPSAELKNLTGTLKGPTTSLFG